jgi:hypothetical protein
MQLNRSTSFLKFWLVICGYIRPALVATWIVMLIKGSVSRENFLIFKELERGAAWWMRHYSGSRSASVSWPGNKKETFYTIRSLIKPPLEYTY